MERRTDQSEASRPATHQIETDGGAVVHGDVDAGGDFVGRDKITVITLGDARRLAAPALLILLGALLWFARDDLQRLWRGPLCDGQPACLVVAELMADDRGQAKALNSVITTRIHARVNVDGGLDAQIVPAESVADPDEAEQLARDEEAPLVVWGQLNASGDWVRIHFVLSDLLGVGESHAVTPLRAQPMGYDDVSGTLACHDCLNFAARDVEQRVDVIAHSAAGLLRYAAEPEAAFDDFVSALHCSGERVESDFGVKAKSDCTVAQPSDDFNPGLLYYYAGKAAVRNGDYGLGIRLLEQAVKQNSHDPAGWIGIGAAWQAWLNDPAAESAMTALRTAVVLAGDEIAAVSPGEARAALYHNQALAYELQGEWEAAAEAYALAVDRFGEDRPAAYVSLVQQGWAEYMDGNGAAAKATLQSAKERVPSAPWASIVLARLTWEADRDADAARGYLADAHNAAPDQVEVDVAEALLCAQWRDHACVADAYDRALSRLPDSARIHTLAGAYYQPTSPPQAGQSWEAALRHYQLAVETRNRDPWAHDRLGYVQFNLGMYEAAVESYIRAIEQSFQSKGTNALYCNLAEAQSRAGRESEAMLNRERCGRGEDQTQ